MYGYAYNVNTALECSAHDPSAAILRRYDGADLLGAARARDSTLVSVIRSKVGQLLPASWNSHTSAAYCDQPGFVAFNRDPDLLAFRRDK
jgi:hypothetical protein